MVGGSYRVELAAVLLVPERVQACLSALVIVPSGPLKRDPRLHASSHLKAILVDLRLELDA